MTILVTGGAGFMGSNFIHYLLKTYQDVRVVNFDKLTYAGNLENLRDVERDKRYSFIKGDIANEGDVERVFQTKPDVVVNFAAETHVDRSILDPKAFIMTDVLGSYTLLEAIKKHGTGKFIQISTDEVFGSIEKGKFTEESPFEPNSPYSASKAGGDHLCRAYFRTYGTPVIVTHSVNFIGPYQYPEKVIPLFITNLMEGKKVPLYGDGLNVREYIYTEDYCRAIDTIMTKGEIGEVYNIGSGNEITNLELTKKILAAMSTSEDMIEYVKDRLGHDRRYSLDWSKLAKLGWKPEYDLDRALEATIEWYKANESWWKPLKSGEYLEYYKKQYQNS
ncbi:MAG: dTDP-glucose 4,6-dehydratase [Candidatus Kerfeldbacteria bacterium]|nr:dTDP-glucose 4,6-dehydratase [Candidatus Kerfeldbacteria bacterium]